MHHYNPFHASRTVVHICHSVCCWNFHSVRGPFSTVESVPFRLPSIARSATLSALRLVATRCTHTALWREAAATQTLRRDAKRSVHPRATNSPRVSDSDSERAAFGRDTSADGRPLGPRCVRMRCERDANRDASLTAFAMRACAVSTVTAALWPLRKPAHPASDSVFRTVLGLELRLRRATAGATPSERCVSCAQTLRSVCAERAPSLRKDCTIAAHGVHSPCACSAHASRSLGTRGPSDTLSERLRCSFISLFVILCDSLLPVRPVR